jgi:hypothetical protein
VSGWSRPRAKRHLERLSAGQLELIDRGEKPWPREVVSREEAERIGLGYRVEELEDGTVVTIGRESPWW